MPEDSKLALLHKVIEDHEKSSSKKTHKITRIEKSLVQKDNRVKELEFQVSGQQLDIQEKESKITELKDNLVQLVCNLQAGRAQGTQVKYSKNSLLNSKLNT